jgi:hypothetical protein
VIALVENNPRALQSNSAAVSRRFSDGNVPLNGQRMGETTYSKYFRRLEDAAAWVKQTRGQLHGEFARH